jgi:hypothetical protein
MVAATCLSGIVRRLARVRLAIGYLSSRLPAASQCDSFDEKSLKEEKHNHYWQDDQTGSGHQQVELNTVHRSEKCES